MRWDTVARLAGRALRRSTTEEIFLRSGINLTRPSDIKATLTERCNYRCIYCDHWRQDSYPDEMSLEEWKAALLSVKAFVGRYTVQFLGGEPTIMPWFFDLVTFCQHQDIDWGVITNGSTLNEKRVSELIAARPLNVDVSIDSRVSTNHDFLRGISGSMEKVSQGVELLVKERERVGARTIVRLKPTVTKQTIDDLLDLVDWAASLPSVLVDLSPVRLWRDSQIATMYPKDTAEVQHLHDVVGALIERKDRGAPIETSVAKLKAIVDHFAGSPNQHGVAQCRVGLRSIDIRPNGDVNHCWKFERIGNLRHTSLADIWNAKMRKDVVSQSVACDKFKTVCSTSCFAHRTLAQDVKRGVHFLRTRTR